MISLNLDRVDIYTWQKNVNNGITSKKPVEKYKDIKCTLSQKNVSNITNDPLTKAEMRYTLFIPIDVNVSPGDKLVVTTRNLTFRAQNPFKYPLLKKQEIEVEIWNE